MAPPSQETLFEIAAVEIVSEQEFFAATVPVPTVPPTPLAPSSPETEDLAMAAPQVTAPKQFFPVVLDDALAEPEVSVPVRNAPVDIDIERIVSLSNLAQLPDPTAQLSLDANEQEFDLGNFDSSIPLGSKPTLQAAPRIADRITLKPEEPQALESNEIQVVSRADSSTEPDTAEFVEKSTAPAHSTSRIVTEAEETIELAAIQRPRRRPANLSVPPTPTPVPEPPQPTETVDITKLIEQVESDEFTDIVKRATAATKTPEGQLSLGVPLTATESQRLKTQIQGCWNWGALSTEASRTTVTIQFRMTEDGRPVKNSIKLVSSDSKSESVKQTAFESGKRAILKCLENGHDLPIEKFERWRHVGIAFNPRDMLRK